MNNRKIEIGLYLVDMHGASVSDEFNPHNDLVVNQCLRNCTRSGGKWALNKRTFEANKQEDFIAMGSYEDSGLED